MNNYLTEGCQSAKNSDQNKQSEDNSETVK